MICLFCGSLRFVVLQSIYQCTNYDGKPNQSFITAIVESLPKSNLEHLSIISLSHRRTQIFSEKSTCKALAANRSLKSLRIQGTQNFSEWHKFVRSALKIPTLSCLHLKDNGPGIFEITNENDANKTASRLKNNETLTKLKLFC